MPLNLGEVALENFSRASERLFGKLKHGVSQAAGEAELTSLIRELIRRQPRSFRDDASDAGRRAGSRHWTGRQEPALDVVGEGLPSRPGWGPAAFRALRSPAWLLR